MQRQPNSSREMQGIPSSINPSHQIPLQQQQNPQVPNPQNSHVDPPTQDDYFFDHMLSNLTSSWPDHKLFVPLNSSSKPRDLPDIDSPQTTDTHHLQYPFDDSTLLASRLRQHQISGANAPRPMLLQQQQMLLPHAAIARSPSSVADSGLIPLPLTLGSADRSQEDISAVNGFSGSLPRGLQPANQQQFHQTGSIPSQNFSAPTSGISQPLTTSAAAGASAPKQRVRARRGQATDPHSIAERLRRERIAERMKALQELVPNANKTDKASMLDEIIDYVKFLQLQVKVLSMSRLGGAAAVAPLVADISSEASGIGRNSNGTQAAASNDSLALTEHQVAKMMEEDMGSAMQYLQGKGLCLMPISLASAISTATCHPRAHPAGPILGGAGPAAATDPPSSPSMSVLTVQSALGNGGGETDVSRSSVKDAASVSKP